MRLNTVGMIVIWGGFLVGVVAVAQTKAKVTDITPSFAMSGDMNTLILTGKNLGELMGCHVKPTVGKTASNDCAVQTLEQGKKLQVTFTPPPGIKLPQNLILSLCKVSSLDCAKPNAVAVMFEFIPEMRAPSDAASADPAAGAVGASTSPYAECLNTSTPSNLLATAGAKGSPIAVNCASSLLTNTEVSDGFGGHVSRTYYAIQVRISNQNTSYDFLLRDILLTLPDGRIVSGRIRRFAQGVALKGKSRDARAIAYNSLQAGTALYGGLAVFASTGFKTVGNILEGAGLAGFAQLLPDSTAENVNRFNTAVFDDQNPSIVPKDSIGQPPLYVVALVPKSKMANTEVFGQRIGVGIEGTFIKQVSLVSIAPSSLDFKTGYLTADQYGTSSTLTTDGLNALRGAGYDQQVTISNNNASPMNVSKVDIVYSTSHTAASTPAGDDFEIETNKGTCGRVDPSIPFDPTKNKFTVAPQSSCYLWVRFHPRSLTDVSANLVVDGDNLDGSKSVLLTGKSAGLVVAANAITGAQNGKPAAFTCVYGTDCTIDLGLVPDLTAVKIPVLLTSSGAATLTLQAQQDSGTAATVAGCTGHPLTESQNPCIVPLPLSAAAHSTKLTLLSSNGWTSVINFTYTTDQATMALTPPTQAVAAGNPVQVKVSLLLKNANKDVAPASTVSYTDTVQGASPVSGSGTISSGGVLTMGALPVGVHTIKITYSPGQYQGDSQEVTVTVLPMGVIGGVPTITETVPVGGKTIPLTVMAASKPCDGSIGVSPGASVSLSLDKQGTVTYTVPAASAGQTGTQTTTFTYSGGTTCAAATQPVVYSYSYASH